MRERLEAVRRVREAKLHAAHSRRRSPDQQHAERLAVRTRETAEIGGHIGISRKQLAGARNRVTGILKTDLARDAHMRGIRTLDAKRTRSATHLPPFCSSSMFSSVFSPCVSSRVISASRPDFAISAPTWFR